MCIISDNIKFCTCVDANIDIEELNHYWVLNRVNKHKNFHIIGEVNVPYHGFAPNYFENQLKITSVLENKDVFDIPLDFKEKDRLQIVLNNTSDNSDENMIFDFEFKSGKWLCIADEDPFNLLNNFDEIDSGEIKDMD